MRRYYFILLVYLPLITRGQAPDSLAWAALQDAVGRFQAGESMRHGLLGISLINLENGQSLFNLNGEKSFPPASTMKLVTTAAALEILGDTFAFETYLEYDGAIVNGALDGNLYIRGTGDPSLGSSRFKDQTDSATVFNNWLGALQRAGIKKITGSIIADDRYFDSGTFEDTWALKDIGYAYGAGVTGLNWNENVLRIIFRPDAKAGAPALLIRSEPVTPGFKLVNSVTTGPTGSGTDARIFPLVAEKILRVEGSVPRGRKEVAVRGALLNPARVLAGYFSDFLTGKGLPVSGQPETAGIETEPGTKKLLHTYQSPPLSQLCRETNWWSVNIYADAMFKTMALKLAGKPDFATAAESLTSFWALKGVNTGGVIFKDGSGLARAALLSPDNLTEILQKASQFKSFGTFYEGIPIAGEAGTVRSRRFGNRLNVRAKSGSFEGTRTYAGYINTRSGLRLCFAVNANRYLPDATEEVTHALMEIVRLMSEL
ncbi:D-alanyl-D-alanine carboxypeptidase/D-alanyl-D-alanine-endopeptidase [Ravibacter arvi]|uniref:D-alanyl-D-alanine carboxypeptidase/D-alanyl-D-alanine-endopeptidase n=1 Tax=Ravibacter arvi TaxID=2051041 RepID=A0ABP8LZC0_9BACT